MQDKSRCEFRFLSQMASLNAELAVLGNTLAATERERQLSRERCNTAEDQLVVCQAEVRDCLPFKDLRITDNA